jgi:hypothetical protein
MFISWESVKSFMKLFDKMPQLDYVAYFVMAV